MGHLKISVIIPVYNAESYIEKAVMSAINLKDVFEVIVINDGCTDNTQSVLDRIGKEYSKLKVFYHENYVNKGRSASRNLGIKKCQGDYIAFLDADDFYLKNRFNKEEYIFLNDDSTQLVYNAVGYHFYREINSDERKYFSRLNTVTQPIEYENQYQSLLRSSYGYLHLNGITVKTSSIKNKIYFNEGLHVAEDSDFIYKLSLTCKFSAGLINEEVAKRGIHNNNIYNNTVLYSFWNVKLYESLISWCHRNNFSQKNIADTIEILWIIRERTSHTFFEEMNYWMSFSFRFPFTICTTAFIRYCPLYRGIKKFRLPRVSSY